MSRDRTTPKKTRLPRLAWIPLFLLLFLLALALYGTAVGDAGEQSAKRRIVLITKSTTSDFFQTVYAGALVAATEYNAELLFWGADTEENYEMQNSLIDRAVSEGANAIILSAVDYEKNAEAADRAAEAGLKIVSIDSNVGSRAVSCRIGTDNYEAGRLAARAILAQNAGDIYAGIVNFDKNTANGQERESGFREEMGKHSRVKSVTTVNVRSSVADAREGMQELLSEHPEINAVATFNEWTSLGVGRAIRKLQKQEEVTVAGFDSNQVCVGMLEKGEIDALIVQNPYAMGYIGVETAAALLKAQALSSERIDTAATLVTRENMYLPEYQKILFHYD